jgi:hypothetical protein
MYRESAIPSAPILLDKQSARPAQSNHHHPFRAQMSRQLLLRLLISTGAILSFALVFWRVVENRRITELPFLVERAQPQQYFVRARDNVLLPAPLTDGQIIDLTKMLPRDRAALVYPATTQPGTKVIVVLHDKGNLLRHSVTTAPAPTTRLSRFQGWTGGVGSMSFLLTVVLLTVWGGRNWTAWALLSFALGQLINNGLYVTTYPPITNFWIQQARQIIQLLTNGPALYLMAESLALTRLPRVWRRVARFAVASLAVATIITTIAPNVSLIYSGIPFAMSTYTARDALTTTMMTLPVLVLVFGHRRATRENSLRIRWMLSSTALLLATTVTLTFMSEAAHPYLYQIINTAVYELAIFGYVYAILRTRIVDVVFVIDRTLAFAATTSILVGAFSLIEQALDRMVIAEKYSSTLRALAALVVALTLRPLHFWSDRSLERMLFRKQRAIVANLRRFSIESAFFETQEALLSEACEHLLVSCAAVAIYERHKTAYKCRAGHGHSWPPYIDLDDPIFVTLRANGRQLDITRIKSVVGTAALAFPMTLGETLTGAVICRPRDGEQLNQKLRAAILELSRGLATSLYLLRYDELARLVADIASGHVDEAAARSRAAALAGNSLTALSAERPFQSQKAANPSDL